MADTDVLRELHEAYIRKVNAAVGQDRMDLVSLLSHEYADEALQLLTAMGSPGCGRPECVICARSKVASTVPTRRRRRGRPRRRHTA